MLLTSKHFISKSCDGMIQFQRRRSHQNYKFVDKVIVEVTGGKGGSGCVSWKILSPGKKRPCGGNGGRGGDVIIVADNTMNSLDFETFQFRGGNGRNGGGEGMAGRRGKNFIIRVPVGTIVTERDLNDDSDMSWEDFLVQYYEDNKDFLGPPPAHLNVGKHLKKAVTENPKVDKNAAADDGLTRFSSNEADDHDVSSGVDQSNLKLDTLGLEDNRVNNLNDETDNEGDADDDDSDELPPIYKDLSLHGDYIVVARGGRSGTGNGSMSRSNRHSRRSIPKTALPGQPGEQRSLLLELKIIADIGLVGLPNAGKSTLLAALTNATPTIASYPFTTLHPYVGVVEYSDLERITIADIPGLIEGASDNRGLGHEFLRHVERTKILLYVLDGSGTSYVRRRSAKPFTTNQPSLTQDLMALHDELRLYDPELVKKPSVVFINKSDLLSENTVNLPPKFKKMAQQMKMNVFTGSAKDLIGMAPLANYLRSILEGNYGPKGGPILDVGDTLETFQNEYENQAPESQITQVS